MNEVWRHRFAWLTALATLALIGIGGLVTSHGVGLAVPDWPDTYGFNLFFFPYSEWVGGVFYEHLHRLAGATVGIMTVVLALWLQGRAARPWMRWLGLGALVGATFFIAQSPERWQDGMVLDLAGLLLVAASWVWPRGLPASGPARRLGWVALATVGLQGLLGGLRVVLLKTDLAIVHAALAQAFLVELCCLAVLTRPRPSWIQILPQSGASAASTAAGSGVRASDYSLALVCTGLIFAQLLLGATMRHQQAGLAIPDFPLAYGRLWPRTDPASLVHYNQQRIEVLAANPITAFQIELQMSHRLLALCILLAVVTCARKVRRHLPAIRGKKDPLKQLTLLWPWLIVTQLALGAATIWSNKTPGVATAHVMVGALSLAVGTIVSISCWQQCKHRFKELSSSPDPRFPSLRFWPKRPAPSAGEQSSPGAKA